MCDIALPLGPAPTGHTQHKPGPDGLPRFDWDRFASTLAASVYNDGLLPAS